MIQDMVTHGDTALERMCLIQQADGVLSASLILPEAAWRAFAYNEGDWTHRLDIGRHEKRRRPTCLLFGGGR